MGGQDQAVSASTATGKLVIRPAAPSDAADLQKLFSQAEAYGNTLQLPLPSLLHWQKKLESLPPDLYMFVACRDEAVIGEISLKLASAARRRHAASLGMAVDAACTRQGVGSALLRAVIELAERWLNIRRIELEVYTDNAAAIALYEKFGFVVEGTARAYGFRDGAYADVHLMARVTI